MKENNYLEKRQKLTYFFKEKCLRVFFRKRSLKVLILILTVPALIFADKTNRMRFVAIKNRFSYDKKYPNESYFAVSVKEIVPCPEKSINVAFFGQSNHGNIIKRSENIDILNRNIFVYDWRLGVCAKYREPLVGVDGSAGGYGHISKDTIHYLQTKYDFSGNIIFMGFTKGGSRASDWSRGVLSNKFSFIMQSLQKNNIEINYVLWHQGESENKSSDKSYYQNYIKDMNMIFNKFSEASNQTKIGMALVSFCDSESSEILINSQKSIIENNDKVFLTLNTDKLGVDYRYDGCHFNSFGASKIGEKYSDLLIKLIAGKD